MLGHGVPTTIELSDARAKKRAYPAAFNDILSCHLKERISLLENDDEDGEEACSAGDGFFGDYRRISDDD